MISKNYKQNKDHVLTLYGEYVNTCKRIGKEVNESIAEQAQKIKDEIFNLMILGEAKSGKSTFINAYLGKEVVPMDVRQCTSSIIKIHKGDKFELTAKTAGGGKTTVIGDDAIKAFLKEHATISDKYRNIPITTINNELLIKYHGRKIPNQIMTSFLHDEAKDNIFNMNIDEYNNLIREYVKENAASWGKIITEMEITYPLPDEMQGITIIDSPGVGAAGNVGKIAEDYIAHANAIIFIKSLNGQALESSSFMNFLRNTCTNRKKESLFLVLTGKANLQGSEFSSLKEQAIEMYKHDIKEEKIICVDSKIQLFLNKCCELGTEEKIENFFDDLDKKGNDFTPASYCWLKSHGNFDTFKNKMEEMSNFRSVQNALEKFARVANYVQLIDFLENLEREYTRYKKIFSETLNIAKENIDDPHALDDRIAQKRNEIAEVYSKINQGIMDIYMRYTDNIKIRETISDLKLKKKREEATTSIRNKNNDENSILSNYHKRYTGLISGLLSAKDDVPVIKSHIRELADNYPEILKMVHMELFYMLYDKDLWLTIMHLLANEKTKDYFIPTADELIQASSSQQYKAKKDIFNLICKGIRSDEFESAMGEHLKTAGGCTYETWKNIECVLWIDEIEKAFSGIGAGNDVTTRLFGQFLTWMQEKENTVFIVATANDISKMPPEFLRKGRFDELFFVDLPNEEERGKIFEIHLKKRKKWNRKIDIPLLVRKTDGYNGADLEAVVKDTVEKVFIDSRDTINTEDLLASVDDTKSISQTLKGKMDEIRKSVEKIDIKSASKK